MPQHQAYGGVSRRRAILTGAGLVAVGAAAGAGGVFASHAVESQTAEADKPKLPVMLYLRDHGSFDVFVGDDKFTVSNPGFAAQLNNAVAKAVG